MSDLFGNTAPAPEGQIDDTDSQAALLPEPEKAASLISMAKAKLKQEDAPANDQARDVVSADKLTAYRVLARKYRPSTFSELIGQDALVRTLTNAIATGKLAQAWMLTGVRGVGKTTTARIIARALNCVGPDGKGVATPTPCGQCEPCLAIAADRHVDVLEMDAASRTGVDDIRDIIDGVRYGPASARYKVYVIDEVHMLSKNAFNALLKTLEEPPPHVKFIFATTEIRKVPVTVLSRCQRFDLRRVDAETLAKHFANVANKEKVELEEEAAKLLARAADGSVRDGLSLLDQAIARQPGKVTSTDVRDMLGLADRAQVLDLARLILTGDMPAALTAFDNQLSAGADPLTLLHDVGDLVHLLTRVAAVPNLRDDASLPELERDLIRSLPPIGIPALTRAWQILLKGFAEVQAASHPAKAAEMVLIRIAYAAQLPNPGDLVRKITEDMAANSAGSGSPDGGGNKGPVAQLRVAASSGNLALKAAPAPLVETEAVAELSPQPRTYQGLVALFKEKREASLYASLYQAQLVRFEVGKLDVSSATQLPVSFAGDVGKKLSQWTGQRWLVSISRQEGEESLASKDKKIQQAREQAALQHPAVKAVLETFPGARFTGLKQRVVEVLPLDTKEANDHANEPTTDITEGEP